MGDRVELDGQSAVVVEVVNTLVDRERWGVDDPGLMMRTHLQILVQNEPGAWAPHDEPEALVFQAVDSASWGEILLLSREPPS